MMINFKQLRFLVKTTTELRYSSEYIYFLMLITGMIKHNVNIAMIKSQSTDMVMVINLYVKGFVIFRILYLLYF